MHISVASPWVVLSLAGIPLLVVWVARLCHRLITCPHCGQCGRHYVGFFRELRTRAKQIGPVYCRHCHARFMFLA